jgi:hypothetical protein
MPWKGSETTHFATSTSSCQGTAPSSRSARSTAASGSAGNAHDSLRTASGAYARNEVPRVRAYMVLIGSEGWPKKKLGNLLQEPVSLKTTG